MAEIEQLEMDPHGAQLVVDAKALVEKYRAIFAWNVPKVDEFLSDRLILKALRQALDDNDAESSAGRPA